MLANWRERADLERVGDVLVTCPCERGWGSFLSKHLSLLLLLLLHIVVVLDHHVMWCTQIIKRS